MSTIVPARRKPALVAIPTHFLSVLDFSPQELESCLDPAARLKAARAAGRPQTRPLEGKHVALLFEKP